MTEVFYFISLSLRSSGHVTQLSQKKCWMPIKFSHSCKPCYKLPELFRQGLTPVAPEHRKEVVLKLWRTTVRRMGGNGCCCWVSICTGSGRFWVVPSLGAWCLRLCYSRTQRFITSVKFSCEQINFSFEFESLTEIIFSQRKAKG